MSFRTTSPPISDHALLRWLERVHDLDVEALRENMAATIRHVYVRGLSSCTVDGSTYMFREGLCTTVVDAPSPTAARRGGVEANGRTPFSGRDESGRGRYQRRHRGE